MLVTKSQSSLVRISSYRQKNEHHLIGIMSGTSLDGIDAVLIYLCTDSHGGITSFTIEGNSYLAYTQEFKDVLLALCTPNTARIDALVYGHSALAEWYAASVEQLLKQTNRTADSIDALCLHGQTVWHAPLPHEYPGPNGRLIQARGTLQIGSAPLLHERTGIPVIHDFRSRDMAAGGEGAPLTPIVDAIFFRHTERGRIVQNIGGIANATVIPAGIGKGGVYAFDTGPGNMIIDELVKRFTCGELRYDKDGQLSAKGHEDKGIIELCMEDPYFARTPPKSTGREVYGVEFASRFAERCRLAGLSEADTLATATAFTAESIVRAYEDFIFPQVSIHDVIVGGGGALNLTLMGMIRERLPKGISLKTTADYGIPVNTREAVAFAILGHEALMGHAANMPSVTGATHEVILGCITL